MTTTEIQQTDPAKVSYLLSLANDMRLAKGDTPLVDLPESIPEEPEHCIIANAFNYGCSVDPGAGLINFESQSDVDTYFKVMNLDPSEYYFPDDYQHLEDYDLEDFFNYADRQVLGHCEAPMTPELIEIAELFDEGTWFQEYVVDAVEHY